MRIWIINHYASPAPRAAGARHAMLSRHLHALGHDVTVLASSGSHTGGRQLNGPELPAGRAFFDEIVEGVQWRFVRTTGYHNAAERFFNMRSFRRNVCRHVDDLPRPGVIIGSCVHPYAVDAAIRLSRRFGVPFVYEIRDIWPESLVDVGALTKWHPIYWEFRRLELRAFRHAAGVIVLFPGMGEYLRQHGIAEERSCYIPNGIDGNFAPVLPLADNGKFTLSYFGAHGPVNGLMTMVEAAAHLARSPWGKDVRLRLVGDGTEKPRLQRRAEELGLTNVEFFDPVPKNELPTFVADTAAFVYCQRRMPVIEKYGFSPNKLSEYMSYHRPIVFSCRSYNNPVEEAGAGFSVEPEDPRALAEAILRLCDLSPAERWTMGANARRYALEHHDLGMLSLRLGEFLERIAGLAHSHGDRLRAA